MVALHPGHVQVFENESVVGLDQHVGNLVEEMATHIGDVAVVPPEAGCGLPVVD
jgi:hypothetical protein